MKITLGTYTKRISKGIYTIELNSGKKTLENLTLLTEIQSASYIKSEGNRLYAVVKDCSGGLRMYENSRMVSQITQEETPPCYISTVENGKFVFTANYHGGHIDMYSACDDSLTHLQRINYPIGSHAHCIVYVKQFDEVIVCDLGLDRVLAYSIVGNQLNLKYEFNTLPQQGPRHFVSHPTFPVMYVFTELTSEVLVLKHIDTGLELIQTIETLPANENQVKSGAAIRISKDGKFLYTSNRGHDSLTVFKVNDSAKLETIQNISTDGSHPRDFDLSFDGCFVVVANMMSDNLTLFQRSEDTGRLTLLQKNIFAPEVTCVCFDS